MIRRLVLCLALLAACAPIEADHPLDPVTPRDQQAAAQIVGRVVLPSGDPALVDVTRVHLFAGPEPDAAPVQSTLLRDDTGRFAFERVTPGAYRLTVEAARLSTAPLIFVLGPGQAVDVGVLVLRDPRVGLEGVVRGRVVLDDGARPDAVTVGAPEAGRQVRADADGAFALALPVGTWTLRATLPGYAPAEAPGVTMSDGADVELTAPLRLVARPGAAFGTVSMAAFGSPERLAACAIGLLAPAGERVLRSATPVDGAFAFEDLAPGRYRLRVAHPAYDIATRALVVTADGVTDVGDVALTHASRGGFAVPLTGSVELSDGAAPGAIAVTIRLADGQVFARLLTAADGGFTAQAAAGERYTVRAERAGYAPVTVAPVRYDAVADRFVDAAGAPLRILLSP
jgi:hypothetical protein